MYKPDLTRQSLTDDEYLNLLGISQWAFNDNCGFIIEMLDKEHHNNSETSWFEFQDLTAGQLKDYKSLIENVLNKDIYKLFSKLVEQRNKIIHSQPTGKKIDGCPIAIYRNKKGNYVEITKEYLKQFIKDNDALSSLIYEKRGF
jgi:hypothetical protein